MRRPLRRIYPQLFGRMSFGKDAELIAEPARHANNKTAARNFFEDGLFQALKNIHEVARDDYPITIYYAFKQQDAELDGTASTGWETMLTALIHAGFQITATQFCVDLFTQNAFNEITFGEADVLARAKNISVGGLEDSGAVISARGRVRLRDRDEIPELNENKQLDKDWLKTLAESNCAWLWVQSLVKVFNSGKSAYDGCAELLTHFEGDTESLKNLAYRLYNICEKKNWAKEGTGYNELVVEWQDILSKRAEFMQSKSPEPVQGTFEGMDA